MRRRHGCRAGQSGAGDDLAGHRRVTARWAPPRSALKTLHGAFSGAPRGLRPFGAENAPPERFPGAPHPCGVIDFRCRSRFRPS
ncbi:MAG: hypothetical protein R3D46_15520 [Defluviimonas denitrificans]